MAEKEINPLVVRRATHQEQRPPEPLMAVKRETDPLVAERRVDALRIPEPLVTEPRDEAEIARMKKAAKRSASLTPLGFILRHTPIGDPSRRMLEDFARKHDYPDVMAAFAHSGYVAVVNMAARKSITPDEALIDLARLGRTLKNATHSESERARIALTAAVTLYNKAHTDENMELLSAAIERVGKHYSADFSDRSAAVNAAETVYDAMKRHWEASPVPSNQALLTKAKDMYIDTLFSFVHIVDDKHWHVTDTQRVMLVDAAKKLYELDRLPTRRDLLRTRIRDTIGEHSAETQRKAEEKVVEYEAELDKKAAGG